MEQTNAKNKKILLVEDEVFIRDLYTKILTKAGYSIVVAEDGEVALQKITENPEAFDLILLDIMLPKLTGLDVLKTVKNGEVDSKGAPVYLLTNLGDESVVKEGYSLGAVGYLLKAKYLPQQLVEEIDKFFVKRQQPGIEINSV